MARTNELSLKAGGSITACAFLKIDTSADEQVLTAGAGDTPVGIAHEAQDRAPGLAGSDSTVAYASGEYVGVTGPGEDALLILGTGGCTRGDWLKPDASGYGVTASSGNVVGAFALQSGTAGAKVRVVTLSYGFKMP